MTFHATDAIDDAVSATRSLLWPFEVGLWVKLAFVVLFILVSEANTPTHRGRG